MLVPGDRVQAESRPDGSAYIVSRDERTSRLERLTPGGRRKTMAANIDMLLIALAFAQPPPSLPMVDELIAFGEEQNLKVALVFSKADCVHAAFADDLRERYRSIGYPAYTVDARHSEGVAELLAGLQGHETLIIGASGVGKSTLFAAIGGKAVIGDVSERTGRGKQTTSSGRLHRLESGTLIDSPGIGEFSLEAIHPDHLAQLWIELRDLVGNCRFKDCRHSAEPDCTLRAAVSEGKIHPTRWASYRRAFDRLALTAQRHP
jgi:ribosome biogenesis GTPase